MKSKVKSKRIAPGAVAGARAENGDSKTKNNVRWSHKRRRMPPGPGRPRGTPNVITREMRGLLAQLADDNYDDACKAMKKLWLRQPGRAMSLWLKVQEFVTPRLQAIALQSLPPALDPGSIRPVTAADAAAAYARMVRGEVNPEAVDFAALAAPGAPRATDEASQDDALGSEPPGPEASE